MPLHDIYVPVLRRKKQQALKFYSSRIGALNVRTAHSTTHSVRLDVTLLSNYFILNALRCLSHQNSTIYNGWPIIHIWFIQTKPLTLFKNPRYSTAKTLASHKTSHIWSFICALLFPFTLPWPLRPLRPLRPLPFSEYRWARLRQGVTMTEVLRPHGGWYFRRKVKKSTNEMWFECRGAG